MDLHSATLTIRPDAVATAASRMNEWLGAQEPLTAQGLRALLKQAENGSVTITSGGGVQWRPEIDPRETVEALADCLEAGSWMIFDEGALEKWVYDGLSDDPTVTTL